MKNSELKYLDETKDELARAKINLDWYMTAFAFLERQEWFKNNRHELTKYIEDLYPQDKK